MKPEILLYRNVRKVLSNFESFFNAERIRIGKLFNRSFPNNKISSFSDVKPPVNKKEPEVKKKPQKSRVPLKKKKARPIVRKKNSMPVVALKPKKKAQKAVEKISIKRPPPKSKDEVKSQEPISRKRKASPLKTPAPAKVARTSSRGRKSESSPTPKNTPTRTSAREKRANDSTDLKSPSRSPSPPPRQSKSFVTPATKKAFPDTQASVSKNFLALIEPFLINIKTLFLASFAHYSQSLRDHVTVYIRWKQII